MSLTASLLSWLFFSGAPPASAVLSTGEACQKAVAMTTFLEKFKRERDLREHIVSAGTVTEVEGREGALSLIMLRDKTTKQVLAKVRVSRLTTSHRVYPKRPYYVMFEPEVEPGLPETLAFTLINSLRNVEKAVFRYQVNTEDFRVYGGALPMVYYIQNSNSAYRAVEAEPVRYGNNERATHTHIVFSQ